MAEWFKSQHRKSSAAGRLTLSTTRMEHPDFEQGRPKTAREDRSNARLDRDRFFAESPQVGAPMSSVPSTRDPLPGQVDYRRPPWHAAGQASQSMNDAAVSAIVQDPVLHSSRSWASASDARSSRSLHSPSVSVSPKTALPPLPHRLTSDNESHKRRSKTTWKMLGGMLHRKDARPPAANTERKADNVALTCSAGLQFENLPQDDNYPLRFKQATSTGVSSNAGPDRIQHSRKTSVQVPRGLTRFEARAQADRLSFAQNPTFPKPLPAQSVKIAIGTTKHRSETASMSSREEDERADSFVTVSASGTREPVQSSPPTPNLHSDVLRQNFERHDSVTENEEIASEPTKREYRQSKVKRAVTAPDLASCIEESEPFEHLPRVPVLSPAILSTLDDPQEYISAVQIRLQESREKLGKSMPRLRPIQRAMTAPAPSQVLPDAQPPNLGDIVVESPVSGLERIKVDVVEKKSDSLPFAHESHGEQATPPAVQRHPNPLFSHPPVRSQTNEDILISSDHWTTGPDRPLAIRSSSLSAMSGEAALPNQAYTPQDDSNGRVARASIQHRLPRSSSLQSHDHTIVQISVARKVSVRDAHSTFQRGAGSERLRPKLLDLSKAQRPDGLHARSVSGATLLESFREE
nr:hypothetical protein CFP56_20313 [Quercus suber]